VHVKSYLNMLSLNALIGLLGLSLSHLASRDAIPPRLTSDLFSISDLPTPFGRVLRLLSHLPLARLDLAADKNGKKAK